MINNRYRILAPLGSEQFQAGEVSMAQSLPWSTLAFNEPRTRRNLCLKIATYVHEEVRRGYRRARH